MILDVACKVTDSSKYWAVPPIRNLYNMPRAVYARSNSSNLIAFEYRFPWFLSSYELTTSVLIDPL